MWNTALIFLIKTIKNNKNYRKKSLQKKSFFSADYVKIIELHVVRRWRRMQSEYMK